MATVLNSAGTNTNVDGVNLEPLVPQPTDGNNTELDNVNVAHSQAPPSKPTVITKGNRVPYVNLFKNNRRANADYKLQYMDTGTEMLEFGYEDIDSVEKTYGICLLGYVLNGKPPSAALADLVRRWGSNVQYQTHDSGWITFTFPNVELKEKILMGGNYMVYGHHLFLKEMPRCFRFREEDMESLPSWVQVFGIPPDCWTFTILSKVLSRVGIPIHVDMLTFDRKRSKYARILTELDVKKPRVTDMRIKLPIGVVDVKIVYEDELKFCSLCHRAGHIGEQCLAMEGGDKGEVQGTNNSTRGRSRSTMGRSRKSRSKSRGAAQSKPTRNASTETRKDMGNPETTHVSNNVGVKEATNGKELEANVDPQHNTDNSDKENCIGDSDAPTVVSSGVEHRDVEEAYTEVKKKKNKNKSHKKKKKAAVGETSKQQVSNMKSSKFFDDMEDGSSCDTEYVPQSGKEGNARYFGNEGKGRQPKIASGSQ